MKKKHWIAMTLIATLGAMGAAFAANNSIATDWFNGYVTNATQGTTIDTTGIKTRGDLVVDGDITMDGSFIGTIALSGAQNVDSLNWGGGPGSSGGILEADGDINSDGGMSLGGTGAVAGAFTAGGGYPSTGFTASSTGDTSWSGNGVCDGSFSVGGGAGSSGFTASSTGNGTFDGNGSFGGTLGVTGATTLSNTLAVTGATTLSSTLAVTGAASALSIEIGGGFAGGSGITGYGDGNLKASGTFEVTGTSQLGGAVLIQGGSGSGGVSVSGGTVTAAVDVAALGRLDVGGGAGASGFTASTTGNVTADGNASFGGTLTQTGAATFASTITASNIHNNGGTGTTGAIASFTKGSLSASGVTNVDSVTLNRMHAARDGENVSFGFSVTVDCTAAGSAATEILIDIPVAANFTNAGDACGSATSMFSGAYYNAYVDADTSNDKVRLRFNSPTTSTISFQGTVQYTRI